jgi:DNA-directed RNA polymerase subunit RPC12/RpoP
MDDYSSEEEDIPVKKPIIKNINTVYICDQCNSENTVTGKSTLFCKKCNHRVLRKKRIHLPVEYICR